MLVKTTLFECVNMSKKLRIQSYKDKKKNVEK